MISAFQILLTPHSWRASLTMMCFRRIWRNLKSFTNRSWAIKTLMRGTLWTKMSKWRLLLRWYTRQLGKEPVPCRGSTTIRWTLRILRIPRVDSWILDLKFNLLPKSSYLLAWVLLRVTKIILKSHLTRDKNLKTKPQFSTAIIIYWEIVAKISCCLPQSCKEKI